jgi:hypothetical protein
MRRAPLLAITLAWLAAGCEDNDDKVFKNGGNAETKPAATLANVLAAASNTTDPVTVAASVDYEIRVTSNSGASLCQGDVQLQIQSDFSLKFPAASIQCVSLTIDLATALGGAGGLKQAGQSDPGVTSDGMVLSIGSIAGATFNPPRPFLLGPIVQDTSKYRGFTRAVNTHVTGQDGKSGDGTLTVNVLDVDTTYTNKYLGQTFDKVLHWTMSSSGFDGVPATDGLLFKKWEWYYNTRPIMIPKIEIVGSLGDLIKDVDQGRRLRRCRHGRRAGRRVDHRLDREVIRYGRPNRRRPDRHGHGDARQPLR